MAYRSQKLVNRRCVDYSKWHYSMQGAWRAYLRSVVKWLTDMDDHHHANGTFITPTRLPEATCEEIMQKIGGPCTLDPVKAVHKIITSFNAFETAQAEKAAEDAAAQAAEKAAREAAREAAVSDRAKLQRQRRLAAEKAAQ